MKRFPPIAVLAGLFALAALLAANAQMTPVRPTSPASGTTRWVEPPAAAGAAASPQPSANGAAAGQAERPAARRPFREPRAAGPVKPGEWQFTSHLAAAASGKESGGGIEATYTSCIRSDNAVPAEFGPACKLASRESRGATITWSMTCANTQVRSYGVARYHGDAMEATVVSRLPGADGRATGMTQHITGRYLGACTQTAAGSEPGAAPGTADVAAAEPREQTAAEFRARRHFRYARHRRYAYRHFRRYGARGGAWSSAAGFGSTGYVSSGDE